MIAFSWNRWLRSLFQLKKAKTVRGSRPGLRLEELENRLAPAVYTWTGTVNGNWSVKGNWASNVAPTATTVADSLSFPNGALNKATTNDIGIVQVGTLTISGSGYTLGAIGTNSIILGSNANNASAGNGTLTVSSTNERITQPIQLGGNATFSVADFINVSAGASLTISGNVLSQPLTTLLINSTGSGTLNLTADDSGGATPAKGLQGSVDVHAGILDIQNANALGTAGVHNTVTVESAATLQVDNSTGLLNGTQIKQSLLVNGLGATNQGALLYLNGGANNSATWQGSVTMDSDTTFGVNSNAGSGNGTLTISGAIRDNSTGHNLTKEGTGELILGGANTYRGKTTINNGILAITNSQALGSTDGTTATGTIVNSTLTETGQLEIGGNITISNELLVLNIRAAANPAYVDPDLTPLDAISGNSTWAGAILLNSNPANLPVIGVTGAINVPQSGNPSLTVGGVSGITGKALTNATGAITGATNPAAPNPIVITTATPHGLSTGETLYIEGVTGNTNANGSFAITVIDTTHFSLNGTTGNGAYTGGGSYSCGLISGSSNLSKVGNGSLILTTPNTYIGQTLVGQGVQLGGILEIENPFALDLGITGVNVAGGNTLELAVDFPVAHHLPPTNQEGIVVGPANRLTIHNALRILGNGWNTGSGPLGALYSHDGINTYNAGITIAPGGAAIGVDAAAGPTGAPYNYDITSLGTALDDSLMITGGNFAGAPTAISNAAGPGPFSLTKLGTGQLILPSLSTYTGATNINQGWVTIESSVALGPTIATVGVNAQPVTTVAAGAALHLLPLSATPQNNQQTITFGGTITGGSFLLSNIIYGLTTLPIAWNANPTTLAANMQTALTTLIGAGNATVANTGPGVFAVTFQGIYQNMLIVPMGIITTGLTGTAVSATIQTTVAGSAGNMTVANNLVLAGTGLNIVNPVTNLPYYPLVNGQGALMSLAGSNNTTGNITINSNNQVGIGVEQVYSSSPTSVNYSAGSNVTSQLTLAGTQANGVGVTGGINKLGSQRLVVQGPGTFAGPVDIRQGALLDQNSMGLGLGGSKTTVEAGTALELGSAGAGLQVQGEQLILNGTGNPALGDNGSLTVLPAIPGSNTNPALGPVNDPTIIADNVWSGNVTFNTAFTVTFQNALGGVSQPTLIANVTGLTGALPTASIVTTVFGGVSPVTNSAQNAIQAMTFGGTITGGTFTLTYGTRPAVAVNWSSNALVLAANIQTALGGLLGGNNVAALAVMDGALSIPNGGSGTSRLTLSGVISDAAPSTSAGGVDLIQSGGGELVLSNNNSYRGTTVVTSGVLTVESDQALGGAGNATNAQTLILVNANQQQAIANTLAAGTFTLSFNGQTTGSLAFNVPFNGGLGNTASVQNALNALSTIASLGGVTVSNTGQVTFPALPPTAGDLPLIMSSSPLVVVTGTTFTLKFTNTSNGTSSTTTAIAYQGNSNDILAILNALNAPTMTAVTGGGGTATVGQTGIGAFGITFNGVTGNLSTPITISTGTGSGSVAVGTAEQTLALFNANQAQTITSTLTAGPGPAQPTFTLTFNGQTTGSLAYNVPFNGLIGNTASVQNALNALPAIASLGGVTVSNAGLVTFPALPPTAGDLPLITATVSLGSGSGSVIVNGTTFTLMFNNIALAAPIPYQGNASDALAIQSALNTIVGGTATVSLSGTGVYDINFTGVPANLSATTSGPGTGTAVLGTGGGTIAANGASLELQGSITVAGEPLVIQGSGAGSAVAVPQQWFSVGPAPIYNGQIAGAGPVSGRVTGLATDPTDPTGQTIYLSAAGGGAWKTINGGTTWTPIFDSVAGPLAGNVAAMFTGSVAVSPNNANVIYVGTGEGDNSADSYYGTGVYRSADGGQTWTLLTNGGGGNPLFGQAVSRVLVQNVAGNDVVYAATDRAVNGNPANPTGVWRYMAGTWTNLTPAGTVPADDPGIVGYAGFPFFGDWSDIALDGAGNLWAAVVNAGNASGVYFSPNPNGAAIWDLGVAGPPPTLLPFALPVFPLGSPAIAPLIKLAARPGSTTVFASVANPGGGVDGVFQGVLLAGVVTWTNTNVPANFLATQGWYDNTIAATAGGNVYVAGVGYPNNLVLRYNGVAWLDVSVDINGNGPHTDCHATAIDSQGNLVLGSDGGVWRLNAATNIWSDLNGNLAITTFNGISVNPNNRNIVLGASQDNGTELYNNTLQANGTPLWNRVDFGDGGEAAFDPKNPNIAYKAYVGTLSQSLDGGQTWNNFPIGVPAFYFPFAVDGVNDNRLVVGGGILQESLNATQGVFASTWTTLASPVAPTNAVAIATYQGPFNIDPSFPKVVDLGANTYDGNTIYVSNGFSVELTKDGGATWVNRSTGLPGGVNISHLVVDPRNRDNVYAVSRAAPGSGAGRVFQLTYNSATQSYSWSNISGNIPNVPAWSMVIDPRNNNLYVGTDEGLFASTNGGGTWSRFGTGLPNVQVQALELEANLNVLTAGTYGRGAWQISLDGTQPAAGALVATSGTPTWGGPIQLAGPTNITADGNQSLDNTTLAGQLTITGVISDLAGTSNNTLNINNSALANTAGTITLAGANTYSGQTNILQGLVIVDNAQALGQSGPGQGTVVNTGTALELESNLNNKPITLFGDGFSFNGHNTGALRSISNSNTYTGTITLGSNSTIGVDSGSKLTIANPTAGIVNSAGNNFNLTKELTGTLVLASPDSYGGGTTFTIPNTNPALTFPSGTVVAQGALNVQNNNALGLGSNATTVLDGAQLQVQNSGTVQTLTAPAGVPFTLTFAGATTVPISLTGTAASDRTLIQNALGALPSVAGLGNSLAIPITNATSGTGAKPVIITTASTALLTSGEQVTISGATGNTTINGSWFISVLPGGTTFALYHDAALTQPLDGTLVTGGYTSFGSWSLPGAGGSAVVSGSAPNFTVTFGGTLLASLPLMTATGTAVSVSATPSNVTVASALNLSGTGINNSGALEGISGANIVTGNVTLAQNAGFAPSTSPAASVAINALSPNSGDSLTIQGVIGGPNNTTSTLGLSSMGTGVVILDPLNGGVGTNNNYSGGTTVAAGDLRLQQPGALGVTPSTVQVNFGATLQLDGSQQPGNTGLTVSGYTLDLSGYGANNAGALDSVADPNNSNRAGNTWASTPASPVNLEPSFSVPVPIVDTDESGESDGSVSAPTPTTENILWYTGGTESIGPGTYEAAIGGNLPSQSLAFNGITMNITFWTGGPIPAAPPGGFNALVVASDEGPWSTSPNYNTLQTDVNNGSLPLGNRLLVTGQDADWHYTHVPGMANFNNPQGFLLDSIDWAANGSGMGAVFLSDPLIGSFFVLGGSHPGGVSGLGSNIAIPTDNVIIPAAFASFPINTGLTSAGLSNWGIAGHESWQIGSTDPLQWTAINLDGNNISDAVTLVSTTQVAGGIGTVTVNPVSSEPEYNAIGAEAGSTLTVTYLQDAGAVPVASLAKVGAGTVILPNANAYSGQTLVNNGILNLQNANALGVPVNNVQSVTVTGPQTGQFQLTFNGQSTPAVGAAGALRVGAPATGAGSVQSALNALSNIQASGTIQSNTATNAGTLSVTTSFMPLTAAETVTINGTGTALDGNTFSINNLDFVHNSFTLVGVPVVAANALANGTWTGTTGVSVTYNNISGVYTIALSGGRVAGSTQPQITTTTSAGTTAAVATLVDGSHGVAVNPTVVQNLTVGSGSGTLSVSFNGSAIAAPIPLPHADLAGDLQSALNQLPSIAGTGSSVTVTQGTGASSNVYTVVFAGSLAQSSTALPLLAVTTTGAPAPTASAAYANTATLQLQQNPLAPIATDLSVNKALTLIGDGVGNAGALESVAGGTNHNSWTGTITLGGDPAIGADSGTTLTISQPIDQSAGDLNTGIPISAASNASPLVITTTNMSGLTNGDSVTVADVQGNTAANGTWFIQITSPTSFALYQDAALTLPVDGSITLTNLADVPNSGSWFANFALTTVGGGTIAETAASANTYGGPTNADGHLLQLNVTGTAVPGDLVVGTGLGAAGSAVVQLMQSNQTDNAFTNVTIHGDGQINVDPGTNQTINNLAMTGGKIVLGAGASLTLDGNVTAQSAAGTAATITGGTLDLNLSPVRGPTGFNVAGAAGVPNLIITALVADFGNGLTKTGSGTLDLANDSPNLIGPTTIVAGDLEVNGDVSTSAVTLNSGATLSSGGTTIGSIVAKPAVTGVITPLTNVSSSITFASNAAPIVITSNSTVGLSNGSMITISGVLGNTAANGFWTIANLNTTLNTFELVGSDGTIVAGVNSAYSSGGTWGLDSFIAPADGSLANANANAVANGGLGFGLETNVGSATETWNSATTYNVALNDPTSGGFSSLLMVNGNGTSGTLDLGGANINILAAVSNIPVTDSAGNPVEIPIIEVTNGATIMGHFAQDSIFINGQQFNVQYNSSSFLGFPSNVVLVPSLEVADINLDTVGVASSLAGTERTVDLAYGQDVHIQAKVTPDDPLHDVPFHAGDHVTFQLYGDDGSNSYPIGQPQTKSLDITGTGGLSGTADVQLSELTNDLAPTLVGTNVNNRSPEGFNYVSYFINAAFNSDHNEVKYNEPHSALQPIIHPNAATVAAAPTTIIYGQPLTITATITPAPSSTGQLPGAEQPQGNAEFQLDYAGQFGSNPQSPALPLPVTDGIASWGPNTTPIPAPVLLPVGTHVLTVLQQPNIDYNYTFNPLTQNVVVTKDNVQVNPTEANNNYSPTFGASLTFQATVLPQAFDTTGVPTGTVFFYWDTINDTAHLIGSASVVGGIATAPAFPGPGQNALPAGVHTIFAEYAGDGNYNASTSTIANYTVGQSATTTGVGLSTAPTNTSNFGQVVTFTATVTSLNTAFGTPVGTVQFQIDNANVGSPVTLSSVGGGNARATFSTALLPLAQQLDARGTQYQITAFYTAAANSNFGDSLSPVASLTVNQAGTTTKVTSSVSLPIYSQAVTFTVLVQPVTPGMGTPDGTVSFYVGTDAFGNFLGNGTLDATGRARFDTGTLSPQLRIGNNSIYAQYNGDSAKNDFAPSNNGGPNLYTQAVSAATTLTTLSPVNPPLVVGQPPTFNQVAFGQPATFVATVSVSGGLSTVAPTQGVIDFYDGSAKIGDGTNPTQVSYSTVGHTVLATFSTATLTVGNHRITAKYDDSLNPLVPSNDANFQGSNAAAATQTVNKADTTTTMQGSPGPDTFGTLVTFHALVQPVSPGGGTPGPGSSVNFFRNGTPLGSANLDANDIASFSPTTSLSVGTYNITAQYAAPGDGNYYGSIAVSAPLSYTVFATGTTTTLGSPPPSPNVGFGTTLTFNATVSSVPTSLGTPTGTVNFYLDGAFPLGSPFGSGSVNPSTGVASFASNTLSIGTHTINAAYILSTNFTASDTGTSLTPETVTIQSATTTTVLPTTPVTYGTTATLMATVSGSGAPPSGTVAFYDGQANFSSPTPISIPGAVTVVSTVGGTVTFKLVPTGILEAGTHFIFAKYTGDANNAPSSTAAGVQQVVFAAPTTVTVPLTVTPPIPPGGSLFGTTLNITAAITTSAIGAGTPTGMVTFYNNSIAVANQLGTTQTLNGTSNLAIVSVSTLNAGTNNIIAAYIPATVSSLLPRPNDYAATNNQLSPTPLTVAPDSTSTTASAPSSAFFGQTVTLTAAVSTTVVGLATPTGTVTFRDNSLTGAILGTGQVNGSGIATAATNVLSVATHTIVAVYASNTRPATNFVGSDNSAQPTPHTVMVSQETTTTTVSAPSTSVFGQPVTLMATVHSGHGTANPAGTVNFYDGAIAAPNLLSGTVTYASAGGNLTATLVYNPLPANNGAVHTIAAQYTPTANFVGSDNVSVPGPAQTVGNTVTVSPAAVSVTLAPSPLPTAAQNVPTTITATVTAAFPSTIPVGLGNVTFTGLQLTPVGPVYAPFTLGTSGTVSIGLATIPYPFPNLGTYSISAVYNPSLGPPDTTGGSYQTNINSNTVSQLVVNNPTATTLAATVAPPSALFGLSGSITSTSGSPIVISTTSPSAANLVTGDTVTILGVPGGVGGNAAANGTWTITLVPGGFSLNGSNSSGSSGSGGTWTLNGVSAGLPVGSSFFGQPVTLVATVTGSTPINTGTVTFTDTTTVGSPILLGSAMVAANGVATSLPISSLLLGPRTITATYNGGGLNAASNPSAAASVTVGQANTDVTVSSSPKPSLIGTGVTFAATISARTPGAGTPTAGTVTFVDISGGLPGVALAGTVNYSTVGGNLVATLTPITTLTVGNHTIQATYLGDSHFIGNSNTVPFVHTVQPVASSFAAVTGAGSTMPLPQTTNSPPHYKLTLQHGVAFNLYLTAFGSTGPSGGVAGSYNLSTSMLLTSVSVLGDTLSNTQPVAFSGGLAVFKNLICTKGGVYTLRISSGSLPSILVDITAL